MGKKLYTKQDISKTETARLGIDELLVLKGRSDSTHLEVVHRRYFKDEKLLCPACHSDKTRCSKLVDRKLKDLIWTDNEHSSFSIIDLIYHQRYLRCDECGESVFAETTEFSDKGCRYTNRLSDALADGTFQYSYKKVCQHYGVPASTASVGEIMRRRIRYRESLLPPLKTPYSLAIVEVDFLGILYPAILGIWDNEVYCLDILEDSSELTCGIFLKTLDADRVETVFVDPVDSLFDAVNQYLPMASVVISEEAIQRYARNAMLEIIQTDGKRFPLVHKQRRLTVLQKNLDDKNAISRIEEGMVSRPRLKRAYDHHQKLMELLDGDWTLERLHNWVDQIPEDVAEFDSVADVIEVFEEQLRHYTGLGNPVPKNYPFAVQGICDAIKEMPRCIFDVLRGRCIFSMSHDTVEENGELQRYGIRSNRLIEKINEISDNIRRGRDYYGL